MTWVRVGNSRSDSVSSRSTPNSLADRGEDLGLLDGVHPEVGLQVEVEVQQLGRVPGHLGHDRHHGLGDLRRRRTGAPG